MLFIIYLFLPAVLLASLITAIRLLKDKRKITNAEFKQVALLIVMLTVFITNPRIVVDGKNPARIAAAFQTETNYSATGDVSLLAKTMRTAIYQVEYSDESKQRFALIVLTQFPLSEIHVTEFTLVGDYEEPFAFTSRQYFGQKYRFVLEGDSLTAYPLSTLPMHYILTCIFAIPVIAALVPHKKR